MNMKTNTICFIILLFLLLGVASAADSDNETLQQDIEQDDTCKASLDSQDQLEASTHVEDKLEAKVNNTPSLQATAAKKVVCSLLPNKAQTKTKAIIKSSDLTMHYNDGRKFTVTIKDASNKAINKLKVKFKVNGKTYTKTTDSKGKASLSVSLKSGKHSIHTSIQGTKFSAKSVKNTITVKSTIKCSDLTTYYKNKIVYSTKFYDKKGKLLKGSTVRFKINGKTASAKTNSKGIGKIDMTLKPGKYKISSVNIKTSESVTKTITVKSILETNDLTMNESDGSKFSAKVLNSKGKASPNKIVTIKVNGKTYTPKSDSQGIASQTIDLPVGTYKITTEYGGLIRVNQITVNKNPNKAVENIPKKSTFTHTTIIPNYVNVTLPYAFHNSAYTLKTGTNGTVKMPKVEVFTVQIGSKIIYLATGKTDIADVVTMDYQNYIIPLKGTGLIATPDKASLRETGIIITRTPTTTEIEYKDTTNDNIELFGVYIDKSSDNSETFTYMKNDKVMAKVSVQTQYYDETGVKYNLAKLYKRVNLDFPYYEITNHVENPVIFTNTGKPVTYSYYTNFIAGYPSREDITTKFCINGREELEKTEQISYGHADKYRRSLGFEVLQTYSIINEKVTKEIVEKWTNNNSQYLNRYGAMNVYGMHLANLETAWLADEIADEYAKEFDVNWMRGNTLTILGGINLEDTYMNILNADMGMVVSGNSKNVGLFNLINSINLPNIEEYVFEPIAGRFLDNTSNSLINVLSSDNYSMTQLGEFLYVFNNADSAMILNTTSGVCNVVLSHDNNVYKGSKIHTTEDCCGVGIIPKDLIKNLRELFKVGAPGLYLISNHFKKIHPITTMGYNVAKFLLSSSLTGAPALINGLISTMVFIQATGSTYREKMIEEKDWHTVMDKITFTRPGYLQSKKIYNIPNKNGGTDYIEVKINDDLTLDRNNAKYISNGQTKQLTKQETYQYFCEDYWTPFSMPTKYWDKSWK